VRRLRSIGFSILRRVGRLCGPRRTGLMCCDGRLCVDD